MSKSRQIGFWGRHCKICGKKRTVADADEWFTSLWDDYCPDHKDQAPDLAKKAPWEDVSGDVPGPDPGGGKGKQGKNAEEQKSPPENAETGQKYAEELAVINSVNKFENHPGEICSFSMEGIKMTCHPILARTRKYSKGETTFGLVLYYIEEDDPSGPLLKFLILDDSRWLNDLDVPDDKVHSKSYKSSNEFFWVNNSGARYLNQSVKVGKGGELRKWWQIWPSRGKAHSSARSLFDIAVALKAWKSSDMPVAQTLLPNGYYILTAYTPAGFFTRITGTITSLLEPEKQQLTPTTTPSIVRMALTEDLALKNHLTAISISKRLTDVRPEVLIQWRKERRKSFQGK